MLYFSTISVVEVGDPSSKKHSKCSAMSLPTPPLLDPAPRTLPSTPRPAAVVQPDIGDGMRPLAETPQKDNRIGWHYCPMWHCDFRTKQKSKVKRHLADKHDVNVQIFSGPSRDAIWKSTWPTSMVLTSKSSPALCAITAPSRNGM